MNYSKPVTNQRSPIINEDPINKYDGGIIIKNTTTTLESDELSIFQLVLNIRKKHDTLTKKVRIHPKVKT